MGSSRYGCRPTKRTGNVGCTPTIRTTASTSTVSTTTRPCTNARGRSFSYGFHTTPVLPSVLKKRSADSSSLISSSSEQQQQQKEKKRRKATVESSSASTTTTTTTPANDGGPAEVRVLHILKKHEGSRRPSSWRNPKITATKEEAHEELQGLLEILQEEANNPKELRATFEELARTESDCSSAKRGGDLGFFGRKKMQPAFEEASFALKKGEMTKTIVDTSSGSHIILRIG
ncbi:parvulin-like peptidyl-prolyl isomerase [Nitzschia inconspicua]|uniref:Peptidyl-prolyl cis-trans isomerase n=1 Tax=Nitzschia inconspicua TaxID=303405 RepID=A0A9K3K5F7_9STRA|nr:parvulin-like peptidyl-prolyl isomerase [Nitzschia inconspicua]